MRLCEFRAPYAGVGRKGGEIETGGISHEWRTTGRQRLGQRGGNEGCLNKKKERVRKEVYRAPQREDEAWGHM